VPSFLGEKMLSLFSQFFTNLFTDNNRIVIYPKQFDNIGITITRKLNELLQTVNNEIRIFGFCLFETINKTGEVSQRRNTDAFDINIRGRSV
jgi:hypothetical protein